MTKAYINATSQEPSGMLEAGTQGHKGSKLASVADSRYGSSIKTNG